MRYSSQALRPTSWQAPQFVLFKATGPVLAVAKIAITQDPWALPMKDGGDIAHRFRIALGLEKA